MTKDVHRFFVTIQVELIRQSSAMFPLIGPPSSFLLDSRTFFPPPFKIHSTAAAQVRPSGVCVYEHRNLFFLVVTKTMDFPSARFSHGSWLQAFGYLLTVSLPWVLSNPDATFHGPFFFLLSCPF